MRRLELILAIVVVEILQGTSGTSPKRPGVICCRTNEEPRYDYSDCTARKCSSIGKIFHCPRIQSLAVPKCDCVDGYARNDCGRCVPSKQCENECKKAQQIFCRENEALVGCLNDRKHRTCRNLQKGRSLAPLPYEECRPLVCDCDKNYWSNSCGQCVKWWHCNDDCTIEPDEACPQPNERRVGYKKHGVLKVRRCSGRTTKFKQSKRNRYECVCQEGFFYSSKSDRCVMQEDCDDPYQCTDPCQGANETYTCINPFNERTCCNKFILRKPADPGCVNGCDCKPKFRRENGVCIPESECNESLCKVPEPKSE